jgi:hypothetical protein
MEDKKMKNRSCLIDQTNTGYKVTWRWYEEGDVAANIPTADTYYADTLTEVHDYVDKLFKDGGMKK